MLRTIFSGVLFFFLISNSVAAETLLQINPIQASVLETSGKDTQNIKPQILSVQFNHMAAFAMQAGQEAEMNLPNGAAVSTRLENITGYSRGGSSWLGWAGKGADRGRVILTRVNGFTFGTITYKNQRYLLEPSPKGSGYILYASTDKSITRPAYGDDTIVVKRDVVQKTTKTPSVSKPSVVGATGTVDMGIFYHSSMRDRWGLGLMARLQFLVQSFDTALVDSGTGIRVNLVHVSEVSGSFTRDSGAALTDFSSGTNNANGNFSGVAALRDGKGFDIATYIRRSGATHNACGVATLPGDGIGVITAADADLGFNIVSDSFDLGTPVDANGVPTGGFSACGIYSMAHEIGHNMGSDHDKVSSPAGGVFSYSNAHRIEGVIRTLMSNESATGERELGLFSSPTLMRCRATANGPDTATCGIVNSVDNVRSMQEQGKNVQLYRTAAPRIVSSILPISRSIKSDATATAFATIINPAGNGTATGCSLSLPGATNAQFSYQTTTAANALEGTANTAVNIAAGAAQNFVFSITPGAPFGGVTSNLPEPQGNEPDPFNSSELAVDFSCTNRQSAESTSGLNRLSFVAETADVMDVIALAATIGNTGIVNTGGTTGVFTVAVSNIGIAGTVVVSGETSSAAVTAIVTVCETNPVDSQCLATPSATVSRTLA
ncbi:hypothetical protein MNBD_ALPHA06-699, partial [hydrothermal vent metagenome]